jgi:hypothetical protein
LKLDILLPLIAGVVRQATLPALPVFGCGITEKGQLKTGRVLAVCREILGLRARNAGIDEAGPAIDAACKGLYVLKTLVAEPHGYGEGTGAVVAQDDDGLVGV